jgi:hypothetical protein
VPAEEADPTGALAAREIVSTRVVDAARERVFKAFTDPDHLVHWWGPKGFTNTFQEFVVLSTVERVRENSGQLGFQVRQSRRHAGQPILRPHSSSLHR